MAFRHLFYDKGLDIYWEAETGRMYASQKGLFLGRHHDFSERTRDRISAISVAKARLRS